MIRIVIGGVGSGKTAMVVREMLLQNRHQIYSNIVTKKVPNNKLLTTNMIFAKEFVKEKRNGEKVYKEKLNVDYWKSICKEKPISVIIDEAHTLINPRRSMSKKNVIMTDFLALLRRIVGSRGHAYGELVFITQLERRLDIIAKEMATKVQYCVNHYMVECGKCHYREKETNETPEKLKSCPLCGSVNLDYHSFIIEVFSFTSIENYKAFKDWKMDTFYDHFYITDIEKVFDKYDTLQWDSLITEDL